SLYERTISPPILRAQGCRAGRAYTRGLVFLDFGKLAYRPRRGGYGTVTFADRFTSNRAVGWAVKSYARCYSECVRKHSRARLARRRGRPDLEGAAGPLRRRRHARRPRAARDLQPGDGRGVGRALAPGRPPLRQADQARRLDDAASRPLPVLRLHRRASAQGA